MTQGRHLTARARVAGLVSRDADPGRIEEARADLKEANAEEYIRRLVESAPPLTSEQRHKLAALLLPVSERQQEAA